MGKDLKLITIKEYCKENNISDSGVRKQIKENKITSLVYNDLTYIVIESNVEDKLKDTIKLLREQKKTLTKQVLGLQKELSFYEDQKEELKELRIENKELNKEIREVYKESNENNKQLQQKLYTLKIENKVDI